MQDIKGKISCNDRVEIVVNEEVYKSSVQDIRGNNKVAISIPLNHGKSFTPHKGEGVEFIAISGDKFNKFSGIVSNRVKDGNLRLIILEKVEFKGRIQRREFFRLSTKINVTYLPVKEDVAYKLEKDKLFKGLKEKFKEAKSIDLSAGGIKIITNEKLTRDTFMLLKLEISEIEEIELMARVVREEEDIELKKYKLGCRFENLQNSDRERIVKFIFEKSREQMKR